MAKLTKRGKPEKAPEKTIHEIRKEQMEKAWKLAKTIDTKCYVGELNDEKYYLVIKDDTNAARIQTLLEENGIQTTFEYRYMMTDTALYLQDDVPKPEMTDETTEDN